MKAYDLGPPMEWSDATKLRLVADYFDTVEEVNEGGNTDIQTDLRRIADRLEELDESP